MILADSYKIWMNFHSFASQAWHLFGKTMEAISLARALNSALLSWWSAPAFSATTFLNWATSSLVGKSLAWTCLSEKTIALLSSFSEICPLWLVSTYSKTSSDCFSETHLSAVASVVILTAATEAMRRENFIVSKLVLFFILLILKLWWLLKLIIFRFIQVLILNCVLI